MQDDEFTTRRYSRTMLEAFGPDATSAHPFEDCDPNNAKADKPVLITCALIVLILVVGAARGWF